MDEDEFVGLPADLEAAAAAPAAATTSAAATVAAAVGASVGGAAAGAGAGAGAAIGVGSAAGAGAAAGGADLAAAASAAFGSATSLHTLTRGLDIQFVGVLVLLTVLYQLSHRFSLAHTLLKGLEYWRPPTDAQIAELPAAPTGEEAAAGKKKGGGKKAFRQFHGDTKLTLQSALLDDKCFTGRPEFARFDVVIFLGALALSAFVFSEAVACVTGQRGGDHTFYVLCVAVGSIWYSLAGAIVSGGWWTDHVKLTLLGFGVFFGASMLLLVLPFRVVDADLPLAWERFVLQLNAFFAANANAAGTALRVPAVLAQSAWPYRIALSAVVGVMGGLYLIPAFRYAACYYHISEYYTDSKLTAAELAARPLWRSLLPRTEHLWRAGSALNFFAPLCVALLWISPLTRDAVVAGSAADTGLSAFGFDSVRLWVVLLAAALQIVIYWIHLQAYLTSNVMILRNFWTEINQKTGRGIQLCLRKVFLDTPTAALQYFGPALSTLFLLLMLKRKQATCWGVCSLFFETHCNASAAALAAAAAATGTGTGSAVNLAVNAFVAPALSYVMFWHAVVWFSTSCFCLLYVRKAHGTDAFAQTILML